MKSRALTPDFHALVFYLFISPILVLLLVFHRAACFSSVTCREAELQFLSGGEAMLLLRDLVRRNVLRDHAVPDTATVSPLTFLYRKCTQSTLRL